MEYVIVLSLMQIFSPFAVAMAWLSKSTRVWWLLLTSMCGLASMLKWILIHDRTLLSNASGASGVIMFFVCTVAVFRYTETCHRAKRN